jgi:single-strand DNA-binding protein
MNETALTITGSLTADPELRFTPSGIAVANFTVASNARRFDKATNAYIDTEPIYLRCTAWRTTAENITNSLSRGARVIVTGTLKSNSYETRDGDKRTSLELTVTEVGASLLWATVKTTKTERTSPLAGTPADDEKPAVLNGGPVGVGDRSPGPHQSPTQFSNANSKRESEPMPHSYEYHTQEIVPDTNNAGLGCGPGW